MNIASEWSLQQWLSVYATAFQTHFCTFLIFPNWNFFFPVLTYNLVSILCEAYILWVNAKQEFCV